MSLEQAFLDRITAEPQNALHRQIYADWLEEQGDPRAELLRIQEQLRTLDISDRPQVEARMHELIAQGVQPLTISRTNSIGMRFVLIFPGQFRMGSPPEEAGREENEDQVNEDQVDVTLTRAFWLGQFVVTQAEWRQVMGSTPWRVKDMVKEFDDLPATYVSWEDACEFCRKLTLLDRLPSGWEYVLPTEAEWEYACRAGTRSRFSFGEDESQLGESAWFAQNAWRINPDWDAHEVGERYENAVGLKHLNPWSLYDMHGNVWEWCRDWCAARLPGGTDPEMQLQGEFGGRTVRGGSWEDDGGYCRSASRDGYAPGSRYDFLGFRVALIPPR